MDREMNGRWWHYLTWPFELDDLNRKKTSWYCRAIRAKKSPCEGWLRFTVGQKRSSSRLVILKSRHPRIFSTTCHLWKCRHCARVYWNLSYPLLSILKVIFLERNPLRFIETLISFIRAFVYCLYMLGWK
jgi:hypothetical protein